jgi:hypothetical protein
MSESSPIIELKAENRRARCEIVLPDRELSVELPDGVSLQPANSRSRFDNEQQLLERLFLLARALATNPDILTDSCVSPYGKVLALSR